MTEEGLTVESVYESLCSYDSRNPLYEDLAYSFEGDEKSKPRDGCLCDNCFYGRDRLAMEVIRLRELGELAGLKFLP